MKTLMPRPTLDLAWIATKEAFSAIAASDRFVFAASFSMSILVFDRGGGSNALVANLTVRRKILHPRFAIIHVIRVIALPFAVLDSTRDTIFCFQAERTVLY